MNLSRNQRRKQGKRNPIVISTAELKQLLEPLLDELSDSCAEGCLDQFILFIELLHKWNQTYNLTSVRDMRQMLPRHILDSLVIRPYLQGDQILDVGSGAGLPGIPLAIAEPQRQFTLVDSSSKKTRFMQQAIHELELDNVTVVHERIENFNPANGFDTIVARAYSSIETLMTGVTHCLNIQTRILAMKGTYPLAELEYITKGFNLLAVERLTVPGMDAERHLVILERHA
jgi:16S rRNA (guanine527-N7)-methyltransferase